MVLNLYAFLIKQAAPLLKLYLRRRLKRGKEDPARLYERFGGASLARPKAPLLWIHAASVGESLSVLKLITILKEYIPTLEVLMTTGTVTSARLLQKILPDYCRHQYIPLDVPAWVERFFTHWHPDVALILESELWPNLLATVKKNNVPLIMANGSISDKSYKIWRFFRQASAKLLGYFDLCFTPNARTASRLRELGAPNVSFSSNLKFFTDSLSCNAQELGQIKSLLANRTVWAATSTHPGEEKFVLECHALLKKKYPKLLTVLVPRHPVRRNEIADLLQDAELKTCYRSQNQLPEENTDVWMIDTIGELGLIYQLVNTTFIGGSLVATGGHNPIEPMKLGCVVITGPHTFNFRDINTVLASKLTVVESAAQLAEQLDYFFNNDSQ